MLKKFGMYLALAAWVMLAQCSNKEIDPQQVQRDLTPAEKQLVSSGSTFGIKLFKEVVRQERYQNILISPLSVAMALGMTYNGAGGETREAMQNTLELQGMSLEEVNQSYRSLIDLLGQLDPKVTFSLANSIWYRQEFGVESTFVALNQTYFDAVVRPLDFESPVALETINSWVKGKTNGKIESILDEIPDYALMYLINAIYFKGTWKYRFDPADTYEGKFYPAEGIEKTCPMMQLPETKISNFSTGQFCAVDLKYGNGDYSMTLLLPHRVMNLDSVMAQLSDENWRSWLGQFDETQLVLIMPKFEIEYEKSLVDVLSALGMGIAFRDYADFTGINRNGNLMLTDVKHKTYVKVDEEGTEAAAVTAVEVGPTSGPPTLVFNHPFIFVIHESHSGTILFIGQIVDPTRRTM